MNKAKHEQVAMPMIRYFSGGKGVCGANSHPRNVLYPAPEPATGRSHAMLLSLYITHLFLFDNCFKIYENKALVSFN